MTLRALFVSSAAHLGHGGGVQQCTNEYISALEHAGVSLDVLPVENDRRIWVRAARRLNSSPYVRPISVRDLAAIRKRLSGVDLLLLNQVALAGALDDLGPPDTGPPRVLLSHGCEITDMVHMARLAHRLPLPSRLRPTASLALASVLAEETRTRTLVHGVVTISPFDAECEEWLGTRRVLCIPRTVQLDELQWSPVPRRFGYVGTLNHAPNLEGLMSVLAALQHCSVEGLKVRIVGGPAQIGKDLAARYSAADYLGELDDQELCMEAATWTAFLHPMFCLPRGCSTKLAKALAWRIPIITTTHGRRGYVWRDGALIEANAADAFVREMQRLCNLDAAQSAQMQTVLVSGSSPSIQDVSATLGAFLADIAHTR